MTAQEVKNKVQGLLDELTADPGINEVIVPGGSKLSISIAKMLQEVLTQKFKTQTWTIQGARPNAVVRDDSATKLRYKITFTNESSDSDPNGVEFSDSSVCRLNAPDEQAARLVFNSRFPNATITEITLVN